ncbi:ANTAR domain-containing response regulator [Brucella intermedia]|uniref:ANTAR domain-containing response regulator n=1 Tax=Brucella intermedia TaxID=94625 RepID=UPI00224AC70F|nr:ANTAR domain-containing protein [Brucella intermedia]
MSSRFTQNFKNRRGIIVSRDFRAISALDTTLPKLGLSVSYVPLSLDLAELDEIDLNRERDVLFVDGDLENPLSLPVSPVSGLACVPIIGLVGVEAPSRLKGLIQAGATSFLRKPVYGSIVYSAIVLCINSHQQRQQMETTISLLEMRRLQRRSLIKAIVEIMRRHNVCDDEAYNLLRKESMKSRMNVEAYAEYFISELMKVDDRETETIQRSTIAN